MFQSSNAIVLYEDIDFQTLSDRIILASVGTYRQPANQLEKSAITFEQYKIT